MSVICVLSSFATPDLQVLVAARGVPVVLQHCRQEGTRIWANPFEKYPGLVSTKLRA